MDRIKFYERCMDTYESPLVICELDYKVIYMNDAAADSYSKFGGKDLIGKSFSLVINEEWLSQLNVCIEWFKEDPGNNRVFSSHKEKENCDVYISAIRNDDGTLAGYCVRHICRDPEAGMPYEID